MTGLVTPVRAALLGALSALGATAALLWTFQDTIGRSLIDPDRTYEAYTPPPSPDYADADTWLARGSGAGPADVFYIHSNAYYGDGNWNAPYDRDTQLALIRDVLLPLEAGPFTDYGRLWAPRYRQPTLYARFTQKHPGSASRVTAYADIRRAFQAFLAERDTDRPFILVGYGDGALFVGRLLRDEIGSNDRVGRRMVAAYAIGMPLPGRLFGEETCAASSEPRCLVAYVPVDRRFEADQAQLRERTLTLAANNAYASTSEAEIVCAPPPLPRGSVNAAFEAEGDLVTLPVELDAECQDGLLIVEPPEDRRLRQRRFFGLQWRPSRVNLFYEPLRNDAGLRLQSLERLRAREANTLAPFGEAEDVRPAEINRIPE